MKDLEQLILSKSRPVQKEAKHIGVSELDKLIMEALLGEASKKSCANVKPRDPAMRFEYVVIEAARKQAAAPIHLGDTAYECARGDWHTDPETEEPTKIGAMADQAIQKCIESGYLSDSDFAGATMAGVSKSKPAWGGAAIEPKTDVLFGKKRISLKMSGAVQAASSEAKATAEALNFIVTQWLDKNATNTVLLNGEKTAREVVEPLFEDLKKKITDVATKKLIAGSRPQQILNTIRKLEKQAEEGELSDKNIKRLEKYKNYRDTLVEKEFIDSAGNFLKAEFNYDVWQKEVGDLLRDNIEEFFNTLAVQASEEKEPPSLRTILVDELLSGRHTFAKNPVAIAQYLVSPEHCFTLVPTEKGYDETIDYFSKIIKLRVAAKGGRQLGTKGEGLNINVGCKVSFRYDIRPSDLEKAITQTGKEVSAALAQNPEILAEGLDEKKLTRLIEDSLDALENKVVTLVAKSIDDDKTAASMIE